MKNKHTDTLNSPPDMVKMYKTNSKKSEFQLWCSNRSFSSARTLSCRNVPGFQLEKEKNPKHEPRLARHARFWSKCNVCMLKKYIKLCSKFSSETYQLFSILPFSPYQPWKEPFQFLQLRFLVGMLR